MDYLKNLHNDLLTLVVLTINYVNYALSLTVVYNPFYSKILEIREGDFCHLL